MSRNRVIKPEFWDDEKICKVKRDARLTFIGLWNNSDDYGVVKGHPGWLKSRIFPYDEDLSLGEFKKWLDDLEDIDVIIPFIAHGESYYFIKHFLVHQKIDKPSKTRNPEPPKDIENKHSTTTRRLLDDYSKKCGDEVLVLKKSELKEKDNTPLPPNGGIVCESQIFNSQDQKIASNQQQDKDETKHGKTPRTGRKKSDEYLLPPHLQTFFDEFWAEYIKKVDKPDAKKAVGQLNPDTDLQAKILAGERRAKKYNRAWIEKDYEHIKNPGGWIRGRRWEDEYQESLTVAHRDPCRHDEGRPLSPEEQKYQQDESALKEKYHTYLAEKIPLTREEILNHPKVDRGQIEVSDHPEVWINMAARKIREEKALEMGLDFNTWLASTHHPQPHGQQQV